MNCAWPGSTALLSTAFCGSVLNHTSMINREGTLKITHTEASKYSLFNLNGPIFFLETK